MSLIRYISLGVLVACCLATPQVTLNDTVVTGREITFLGFPQEFFGGIPFAYAPRFSPPLPRSLNGSTFSALQYGDLCLQVNPTNVATSEDCLSVNILRPVLANTSSTSLPVMVWFYPGGFYESEAVNASGIVANSVLRGTPVIHVSLNYRLGPFGFPQGDEATALGALNLGLKDQVMALEWIQSYIGAFGGDPSKVTLFGLSAGSSSISLLYLNAGLENFARATIMESGWQGTIALFGPDQRQPAWETFANATPECAGAQPNDTFSCLRQANVTTLLASWGAANASWGYDGSIPQYPFAPVIDGENGLIPDTPCMLFAKGHFARVPFITGDVLDEGTVAVPLNVNFTNVDQVVQFAEVLDMPYNPTPSAAYQAAIDQLLTVYPDTLAAGSPFGTGNDTFGLNLGYKPVAAAAGDFAFQALRRAWMQAATSFGVKAYGYLFAYPGAVDPSEPWLGIQHTSELPYVYGTKVLTGTPADMQISFNMMDYWTSFATSLDPNDGLGLASRAYWEPYEHENPLLLQIEINSTMIPDTYRQEQMDFINSVPDIFGH